MAANGTEAVSVSNLKAVVDNLSTRVDAGGGGRTVQRGDYVRHHPAVG